MLTEQSIRILKANGWSENRSIAIDEYRRKLKEKEFKWNKYYEEFVKKYGGLYILFRRLDIRKRLEVEKKNEEEIKEREKGDFNFDILYLISNDYGVDVLHERIDENNKNWIPIGQYSDGRCSLFMDENGKVYLECDEDILNEFDNIEDFINKEFIRTFAEVIE